MAAIVLFSLQLTLMAPSLHRVTCLLTGGLIRQLRDRYPYRMIILYTFLPHWNASAKLPSSLFLIFFFSVTLSIFVISFFSRTLCASLCHSCAWISHFFLHTLSFYSRPVFALSHIAIKLSNEFERTFKTGPNIKNILIFKQIKLLPFCHKAIK